MVMIPKYVPSQSGAETRQLAVIVTVVNGGPQEAKLDGFTVRLILAGLLTLV